MDSTESEIWLIVVVVVWVVGSIERRDGSRPSTEIGMSLLPIEQLGDLFGMTGGVPCSTAIETLLIVTVEMNDGTVVGAHAVHPIVHNPSVGSTLSVIGMISAATGRIAPSGGHMKSDSAAPVPAHLPLSTGILIQHNHFAVLNRSVHPVSHPVIAVVIAVVMVVTFPPQHLRKAAARELEVTSQVTLD